jgi:hypothetical protein
MKPKTLLIVGTSFHTLRDYILQNGYSYVTLKDIRLAKSPEKNLKRRIVCDFSDKKAMFSAVDKASKKYGIDGVIATYENYILYAAEIAQYLKLPGIPIEAARACTDKYLMRSKFADATKKISPDFAEVRSKEDLENFAANHDFPLILKPANLSKSLLVFKNNDHKELIDNYQRMTSNIDKVYAKYSPNNEPKIIVEEFMEGSVHSVDAFIDSKGIPHVLDQVVDYQTGYDIGYTDNFHYSRIIPSSLPDKDIAIIREVAKIGCSALGMKSSPAHIEVIFTKQGPRIVEIGARNGGYRERMHGAANGIDITGNAINLALGKQPFLTASRNDHMGVFELFPKTPGIFSGIENEKKLKSLPSFEYCSVKVKPGTFVGKAADGFKMCAVVILRNSSAEQFKRDRKILDTEVRVKTSQS